MIKIKNALVRQTGGSYVLTVPRAYVKNEAIKPDTRYDVMLEEAKDAKANKEASDDRVTSGLLSLVSGLFGGPSPSGNFALFS